MEGLGFPFFVLIAWVVFSVIRSAAKAAGDLEKKRPPPTGTLPTSLPGSNPGFLEMLRQLERASRGQPAQQAPRPAPAPRSTPTTRSVPAPGRARPLARTERPEFTEDVRSLEVSSREEVSLDTASEAAARRRREVAARRERPRTAADHAAFDARIRAEPAEPAEAAATTEGVARLRSALVWSELLSPPVSLRDERDPRSR